MQRITITIEDDLLAEIDAAAEARGYQNRSEIIRDLARAGLQQSTEDTAQTGPCVAGLVHLDHDNCMEMTALRGDAAEVKHFADHIIAERGVRYGRVMMIPTGEAKPGKPRKHGHGHELCEPRVDGVPSPLVGGGGPPR